MSALILPARDATIRQAASILKCGGLVGMPTETVYGLAANAADPEAVARLYTAKGRPLFNPLIAHVSGLEAAKLEGRFNTNARRLAEAFWPGPLTLVVPVAESATICDLARAGLDTVALRTPAHPVARDLVFAFGGPLVAPSANPSGRASPTTASHVAADMSDAIDLVLDGGGCAVGIESTIIACLGETVSLLRPGGISVEDLEAILGKPLSHTTANPDTPASPGQLTRHYATRAELRLNAAAPQSDEAYLGFGPVDKATLNLSATGDLKEAAANLFSMLRALDESHTRIAVAPIPMTGPGGAINDRLARAAKCV